MYRFLECKPGHYMARDGKVTKDVTLRELEALFVECNFNAFPVMQDSQMVGIATKFDFLKAIAFTTHEIVPHYMSEYRSRSARSGPRLSWMFSRMFR